MYFFIMLMQYIDDKKIIQMCASMQNLKIFDIRFSSFRGFDRLTLNADEKL